MTEAEAIALLGFIFLSLGVTIFGFLKQSLPIAIVGGLCWIGLAVSGFTGHGISGTYGVFNYVFLLMALVCFILPITWTLEARKRAREEARKSYKSEETLYLEELHEKIHEARRRR